MYDKTKQFYGESNSNESEFNEAIAQIRRIGENWLLCHSYRRNGNLFRWNITLDCIWMELYADSEDGDKKKISEINKMVMQNKNQRDKLYQVLLSKEGFLRELQEGQKKGGKKREDLRGL